MAEKEKESGTGHEAGKATPPEGASKEEQIGFHKGSLATLAKERQELGRILGIVEQLMQMHVKALKELGVDLVKEAEQVQKKQGGKGGSKSGGNDSKPIEDLIK
ncbi:MAG: hypothetical protein R6U32_02175 [Candidatus Woesearchaeota archaeon]